MNEYKITRMNQPEVRIAVDWAANEGWNPGLDDARCFYAADPQGFFSGTLNGKIIAVGSAVIYDEQFAFCGLYIVDKAYRDHGYGLELTKARLKYVGDRNVGIDGVIDMLDKYQQLGYTLAHNNARYSAEHLSFPVQLNPAIVPATQINFELLSAYDRMHFPAARSSFLNCWIHQKNALALCYMDDNKIKGYGVIRACRQGFKIGPLFASTPEIADTLFQHLAQQACGAIIFFDIPEVNSQALELTKRYRMVKVFSTARMYLKEAPQLPLEQIYGITSFELG